MDTWIGTQAAPSELQTWASSLVGRHQIERNESRWWWLLLLLLWENSHSPSAKQTLNSNFRFGSPSSQFAHRDRRRLLGESKRAQKLPLKLFSWIDRSMGLNPAVEVSNLTQTPSMKLVSGSSQRLLKIKEDDDESSSSSEPKRQSKQQQQPLAPLAQILSSYAKLSTVARGPNNRLWRVIFTHLKAELDSSCFPIKFISIRFKLCDRVFWDLPLRMNESELNYNYNFNRTDPAAPTQTCCFSGDSLGNPIELKRSWEAWKYTARL